MPTRSKDPLSVELELHVIEDDLDSLDYDLRPPFVCGMPCPVIACSDKPYKSINTIWKHWKKVHRQFIPLFKCLHQKDSGLCGFTASVVGTVRKHGVNMYKLEPAKWNITKVMVLNKNYIPPGDSKCPKRASSLDIKGRETAAAERHSRPILGSIQTGENVNRDESMMLTKRTVKGQTEYKAHVVQKPHWKPNPHCK